jgi:hypothetical protein
MEVPRHWRLQKTRYGNGEGELKFAVCPVCGEKIFPPNRPICTRCSSSMTENIVFQSDAVGVGALTFVATEKGLKLLFFDDVDSNHSDDESRKKERIIYPENQNKLGQNLAVQRRLNKQEDVFTRPTGINTVTGRVENESELLLDFLDDNEDLESLSFKQLPPAFVNALFFSMLREIEEEVPGLSSADLRDKVHFFSKSSFRIEQIRPLEGSNQELALYNFVVFVLAILINEEELAKIKREGWRLYSPKELSSMDKKEFRKATLAVLDFLPAALLFLAEEGKIPQEELARLLPQQVEIN